MASFNPTSAVKSDGFRTLREGQIVEFTIILEGDKTKAVDVTAPGGGPVRRGSNRNNRGGAGGGYGFSDRRNGGGGGGECYYCGDFGHMARDCIGRIGGGNDSSCYNYGGMGIGRGSVQVLAVAEVEIVELVLPVVSRGIWRGTVWVVEAIVELVVVLGGLEAEAAVSAKGSASTAGSLDILLGNAGTASQMICCDFSFFFLAPVLLFSFNYLTSWVIHIE